MRLSSLRRGGASLDSEALAWSSAATLNGGTYTGLDLNAMSAAIKDMRAANLWTKVVCMGPYGGADLASALVQYKQGAWAPAINVNFVGGDYTRATGLTGNGSTKHIDTGLVANTGLVLNDTTLLVYNRAPSAVGGGAAMGCNDGANFFEILTPFTDGLAYSRSYNNTAASGLLSAAVAAPYGLIGSSRTGAGSHVIYKGGVSVISDTNTGGALPARSIYVHARNSAGVANVFTSHPFGSYFAMSGLTAGDMTNLATIQQTYQTTLGRNV